MLKRMLSLLTGVIYDLPVLTVMLQQAEDTDSGETPYEDLLPRQIAQFKRLGVKKIILSGHESLHYARLQKACELLKAPEWKLSLVIAGAVPQDLVAHILRYTHEVTVSLDGSPDVHNKIKNSHTAFKLLEAGIQTIKRSDPSFPVFGHCVLQKANYAQLTDIIATAKALELDGISFAAADVESTLKAGKPCSDPMLDEHEVREFEKIIKESFHQFRDLYHAHYLIQPPEKMLDIVIYYKALLGRHDFPLVACNVPWVSAVLQADGQVKPCPFHPAYGVIGKDGLTGVINARSAIGFRKNLDVRKDPTCERCVQSRHLAVTALP